MDHEINLIKLRGLNQGFTACYDNLLVATFDVYVTISKLYILQWKDFMFKPF